MDDPITERQGNEIIRLLKEITKKLEEINSPTAHLSKIAADLEQVQKNVFGIWLKMD